MSENERLAFIIERDGEEAAQKFAEQGLFLYLMEAIKRSPYKDSIDEYIRFLEQECDKQVEFITIKDK